MNRNQLAHLLRAASRVVEDANVLVIGSQSILGTYEEDDLPVEATTSIEADIAFLDDPARSKADRVEGAIGEFSGFHAMNGIYAERIHIETAVLPAGWRHRLVQWDLQSSHPATPHFLDPHDLAISKLIAAREKDVAFVNALIRAHLLEVPVLVERARLVDDAEALRRERVLAHLSSY
ncbi:hypothetical protein D9V32_13730 [Mycetocola tolaasinivorans]|uniref:DUF6036 domain-containing protein n=1 Tax=Mycetocola tolaasinivorans TaxID=76635 RepID=A0A3L7A492_9MICO|nr:DUF6036 family nucleotidyltransferase [Mycetocola tolaasinivorans]RLP74102.1 hypothetical protein D9V32_13730 [Mycetocola tolaasinivorans]